MILRYLHRSNCISSNFSEEIKLISHEYEKADHPKHFVNNIIRQFQDRLNQRDIDDSDDYITPLNFFRFSKIFYLNRIATL